MRLKNKDLAKQWIYNSIAHATNHTGSFRVEENRVYTYNVLLAYFEDGNLHLNTKQYSNTSSRHRNLVRNYAEARGLSIIEY